MKKPFFPLPSFLLLTSFLALLSSFSFAQKSLLQSGPMVGYSEMKEVALWVQTTDAAGVKFVYWEKGKDTQKISTATFRTEKEKAYTATIIADKVNQGKTYSYQLFINNKKIDLPYELEFQTQKLWQWREDPPAFKIALGSCAYVNDSISDRPGKPYGGEYQIFKSIKDKDPDVMLWLGDNNYLREADWNTRTGIFYRYTHSRSLPELQPLLGATHHYAIWDDHDYGPNDADRSYPLKNITLEAFKTFWANPNYIFKDAAITGTFLWSDAQFFLMDDRWFRSPNNRTTAERTIMGKEQFQWLIDALKFSQAPFKFVAIGGQVLNDLAKYENYATYEEERAALIKAITDEKIPGVIFLTGDRHHTELTELKREGTYPLRDLTVSPLTSGSIPLQPDEKNTLRVPDTYIGVRNFAIMEFSGKRKEREMKMIIYDTAGKELWSKVIKESELK
jgi:alkaline phosphatase D